MKNDFGSEYEQYKSLEELFQKKGLFLFDFELEENRFAFNYKNFVTLRYSLPVLGELICLISDEGEPINYLNNKSHKEIFDFIKQEERKDESKAPTCVYA